MISPHSHSRRAEASEKPVPSWASKRFGFDHVLADKREAAFGDLVLGSKFLRGLLCPQRGAGKSRSCRR